MPARSKAQKIAMQIALAAKKGKIPKSRLKGASKKMSKMSIQSLEDYVKTQNDHLPKYVKENLNEGEIKVLNSENIDFYVEILYKNLKPIIGTHFLFIKARTNLSPSISINFALNEQWPDGVINNDPGFIQLMIHIDHQKGCSLSFLTRNYSQKTAGINPPKKISGSPEAIIKYLIEYFKTTIPLLEKIGIVKESLTN